MHATSRVLLIAAACAGLGVAPGFAQAGRVPADSLKRMGIRRLLEIQRTDSLMLEGIERALAAQPMNPDLPEGFYEALVARARRDVAVFVERLVPVYDSLYTAQEVDALIAFYRTPLGRRLIETQPQLMDATMQLGQQWGMELTGQVLVDLSRQRPPPR
jgi:hypothetical protein